MSLFEKLSTVEKPFTDLEKENMSTDDLTLKTKFGFNAGKHTFSSKSVFGMAGAKAAASHEYTLKHQCSKVTAEFKHNNAGTTSAEIEGNLHTQDKLSVSAYVKSTLEESQASRKMVNTAKLRVSHSDNVSVFLGLEDHNCCSKEAPVYSIEGSYGHVIEGIKLAITGYTSYNSETKYLQRSRFFIKGVKGDFSGFFHLNILKGLFPVPVKAEDKNKVTEKTDKPVETSDQTLMDVSLKFVNVFDKKTKVGGSLDYNLSDQSSKATLSASHSLDKVKLNAKLSTDNTFTAGITSTFDDITISAAARTTLNSEGENEKKKQWLTYKLGVSAEFSRV